MEEVLRNILESLVDNKKAISIKVRQEDGKDIYTVKVAPEDGGKIIGRQGKIAKAIKTITKALGAKEGRKVEVVFSFKK